VFVIFLLMTLDLETRLAVIPGFLLSGAVIDWQLKRRTTVNGLTEAAVAAGAFIAGSLLPAALIIGAFVVALNVA
jgi:hypothetical protein